MTNHEHLEAILEFLRRAEEAGFDTSALRVFALSLYGVPTS